LGAVDDLWGGTWTGTHIKSSNFRIRITAKATGGSGGYWSVDYCTVTVTYTAGITTYTKTYDVDTYVQETFTKN